MGTLPDRARHSIRPVSDVAVFTIVQDEPEMLPVWRSHYESAGDLYVLDHDSIPPVEGGIVLHHKWSWDFTWWHDMVQQFQEALFAAGYQVVIFSTPDELLVTAQDLPLADYIRRNRGAIVRPTAYEVIDMSRAPSGYDQIDTPMGPCFQDISDRPIRWNDGRIWEQRRWWVRNGTYDKPVILRMPYLWSWGLHSTKEDDPHPDPNLWLLHLHRIDYENAKVRHTRKLQRPNHTDITVAGSGGHNLLVEDGPYVQWFYHDVTRRKRTPWSLIHAGV